MNRKEWEDKKGLAWMELRHASFALAGKGMSNLMNDHSYADRRLHDAAMEYARTVRAEPGEEK